MCGRFTLRSPLTKLVRQFEIAIPSRLELPEFTPRYNIAPTQPVAAIRAADGRRELVMLHWGLIPARADEPKVAVGSINARSETADTKPMFREAFRRRRCLIPADGFYEWKPLGRPRQAYFIHAPDDQVFAFAGLWERWSRGGLTIESCAILTTDANRRLAELHDRMPVVLDPRDYNRWLDPSEENPERLKPLLEPCPNDFLAFHPVGPRVNRAENEGPECIAPVAAQAALPGF